MILELNAQDIIHPAEIALKYFFHSEKELNKALKRKVTLLQLDLNPDSPCH